MIAPRNSAGYGHDLYAFHAGLCYTPGMSTLSISLPPETEAKLRKRAAAAGQDLPTYVAHLVTCLAEPPTPVEELSGPVYQRFLESGMSDDELGELLERAKHEMRAERRARERT